MGTITKSQIKRLEVNALTEMKNTFSRLISRLNIVKEITKEHKDRSTELLNLKHRAKRENKIYQSI